MIQRELNLRHVKGLFALARRRLGPLELEAAIGKYSTNTIQSLEQRELVQHSDDDRYQLTAPGARLVEQIRAELRL